MVLKALLFSLLLLTPYYAVRLHSCIKQYRLIATWFNFNVTIFQHILADRKVVFGFFFLKFYIIYLIIFIIYYFYLLFLLWGELGNETTQRRSDEVDLCEINYLGSSLIDFCISTGKRFWLSLRRAPLLKSTFN